ncbi:MAG: hypothetical protein ACU84Q_11500 [Gammaproteobacteria bacterium]
MRRQQSKLRLPLNYWARAEAFVGASDKPTASLRQIVDKPVTERDAKTNAIARQFSQTKEFYNRSLSPFITSAATRVKRLVTVAREPGATWERTHSICLPGDQVKQASGKPALINVNAASRARLL